MADPLWSAFWCIVQQVCGFVVVILIGAVQGGVAQVSHGQEVHCRGRSHRRACQEAVHLGPAAGSTLLFIIAITTQCPAAGAVEFESAETMKGAFVRQGYADKIA